MGVPCGKSGRWTLKTSAKFPEKLRWRRHLVQHVGERLRASLKVGDNPGAISVFVIGGAGVGVVYSMSQRVVEQGGDLACSCGHRFGLADACGEPSIEGAQRRLRAADGHRDFVAWRLRSARWRRREINY